MEDEKFDQAFDTEVAEIADLEAYIGKELGLSNWLTVTQERVDAFGEITEDPQWIHSDVERAKKYSPFGTTIAHGFLILSLASKLSRECYDVKNTGMGINYGLDRVRFTNAVKVDAKIRGRVKLSKYEEIAGGAKLNLHVVLEIKGEKKPACVIDWVVLLFSKDSDQ